MRTDPGGRAPAAAARGSQKRESICARASMGHGSACESQERGAPPPTPTSLHSATLGCPMPPSLTTSSTAAGRRCTWPRSADGLRR